MRIPTAFSAALAALAAATLSWSAVAVVSAAPPKCADLSGVVNGTTCQLSAEDPGYTMNVSFPTDYPDAVAMTDYVKQIRDGFLNVAKMPDGRAMPYELDMTQQQFNSTAPPRATQSVVFKTYQQVGGAHPTTFYKSLNWDQVQRKPITIDTLFRAGTAPFPVILPVVQSELEKQIGTPVTISPGVGLDPKTYENFALTDDAVIFFFSQGVILPESAGAVQVSVPRGPVDAMLG
jgi:hypothetical protein